MIIAGNIKRGSLAGFGQGDDGGDQVVIGEKLADSLGVSVGDPITLISPTGGADSVGRDADPQDLHRRRRSSPSA